MATLDDFRSAANEPIRLDTANTWIPDVRLSNGDINGRTIVVEITDGGMPVTDADLSASLAYNTTPGQGLGDRTPMSRVPDAPTATFSAALPRAAVERPGRVALTVELNKGPTRIASRTFAGHVERAAFDASSTGASDTLGQIEQLIADSNRATANANNAASNATKTAADAAAAAKKTASDAAADATKAANDARDAVAEIRSSKIEFSQLSGDAQSRIAAMAAAGVPLATQEEIDQQYEDVIEPSLAGSTIPPLTQEDVDWALDLINQ